MQTMQEQRKVLAIDDDDSNIEILKVILEADYELETASTGEEALERLSKFQPDVILLDVMMPGIDGYQFCRRIRNDFDLQDTAIVMVSAKGTPSEELEAYAAGADNFLSKPIDDRELLSIVREHCADY
jgi:CheY-like chemotaxis protein